MSFWKKIYDHDEIRNGPRALRWTFYAGCVVLPLAILFLIFGPRDGPAGGIDFGDNSSSSANNGECDDPRFIGSAAGMLASARNIGRDAEDCRALYRVAGGIRMRNRGPSVRYNPLFNEPDSPDAIVYGDDAGSGANDGKCQDMRFATSDMVIMRTSSAIGHDASDCRAAVAGGRAEWIGDPVGRVVARTIPEAGAISFDLEADLEQRRLDREGKPATTK